jgi:polyisoprenoid-binding protein YceI
MLGASSMKPFAATAALGAVLLAGSAFAQMASPDPKTVQPGSYAVEPSHTRVQFSVTHFGFTTYWGDVTGVSGDLVLDPKNAADDKVSVSIPVSSVSTTNGRLDGELKSPQFLDATTYPTITFVSRSVKRTGPTSAVVTGDLTLHGVTKPVTLDAKFNAAGGNPMSKKYTVGFDAHGKINRSDFGVKAFVPMVSDQVDITISAAFEKTAG